MQGRLWARNDDEREALVDAGYDLGGCWPDDLVAGDDVSSPLRASRTARCCVAFVHEDGAVTDSIVMRSRSGTVRRIEAHHEFEKLARFAGITLR